jgi:2-polyprenyl-3-methyl-5-hydroxy-6-metoxy-1,4-benzoquinol methylase
MIAPGDPSPCPSCDGRRFRKLFTKGGRDFWRCRACGLERQYPLPPIAHLRAFYDASYTAGMYEAFTAETDMKRLTAARRLAAIRPHVRGGRWLDVGCSNGPFVELAREHGMDAEGIDLSAVAVEAARARGVPAACATLDAWQPAERYDTITAFDVLEHTADPVDFLRAAHARLAPGGTIALTLPDQGSLSRRLMGRRWYFYMPEEHLHLFNRRTLARLLGRTGFSIRRCGPTAKPLTWRYSLLQLQAYNPLIHKLLAPTGRLPARLVDRPLPLYIGEMLVIAARPETA